MRRREFISLLGGAIACPLGARAQQATTPLIGFLSSRSPNESEALVAAFRQGLAEAGYVEGQNVHLAFRWAEGRYDRFAPLAAELVRQQVKRHCGAREHARGASGESGHRNYSSCVLCWG